MTYRKGQSGNPDGRPPGSRNKLTEAFLRDVLAAWEAKGAAAVLKLCDERPYDFVKLVATILPKNFNLKVNDHEHINDDELDHRIAALRDLIDSAQAEAGGSSDGEAAAQIAQPSRLLSALSEAG
jgi:uncharacterized small protein (DUF1192 family)